MIIILQNVINVKRYIDFSLIILLKTGESSPRMTQLTKGLYLYTSTKSQRTNHGKITGPADEQTFETRLEQIVPRDTRPRQIDVKP